MKKLIIIILLFAFPSCVKYQVIQKLDDNMYHLATTKGNIAVVITPDKLKINKFYKLKHINIIND